jgi:hypothetical protein
VRSHLAEPLGVDGKPRINLVVRLGGIYELERIAKDLRRNHWTIMEVLTAYVRKTPRPGSSLPHHWRAVRATTRLFFRQASIGLLLDPLKSTLVGRVLP